MRVTKVIGAFMVLGLIVCLTPFTPSALAAGSSTTELSANYLTIPGGESIARIMVENKDSKAHHYNLEATGLPEGFKAYFTLQGKGIKGLDLSASEKRIAELHLNTPLKATQDYGLIKVKSSRDDGLETLMSVSFTVNHDFSLEITNQIKKLETLNGKSLSFDIAVTNTGNKELKDLGLKAELPYKWTLDKLTPEKLSLKPGENGAFRVTISIPPSQGSGNSILKIKSFNGAVASQEISIPVTVTATAGYAWWVIGLVLVVGIVTIIYFRKNVRR
ncbi:MAG TPA: NEW3 domain-containing protein [Desulfosporosinus sp.]|nr:NEW3 domain-containing protein [Desulfosporosinus sp.]